jgi:hypothetical protein
MHISPKAEEAEKQMVGMTVEMLKLQKELESAGGGRKDLSRVDNFEHRL